LLLLGIFLQGCDNIIHDRLPGKNKTQSDAADPDLPPDAVWDGDWTADSQSKISSITRYTEITGTLVVENASVFSLKDLKNLRIVGGDLIIRDCKLLSSLEGLSSLRSVGGTLQIEGNNSLQTLSHLDRLESIGGDLIIRYNYFFSKSEGTFIVTGIRDLTGLGNLSKVGRVIIIESNWALVSISGLDKLASVGTELDPADKKVTIESNNISLPLTEVESLYYRLIAGQFDGKVYFNGDEIILN
jgi:hypothetical protein